MDQCVDQDREMEIKKQQMAAAAYFFKKTDQYIAFEKIKSKSHQKNNSIKLSYNFHKVISLTVPHLPPCLHKAISSNTTDNRNRKESDRIQVLVQLLSCPESSSCISTDPSNNCISLTNPTPSRKFTASNAPKLFPVDAVINEDCPIMEVCSNALGSVIKSVANGEDACVISFGNVPASDLNPIVGSDKSPTSIGIMPSAILWLFNYIKQIRKQEYARFSVRISAAEISGKSESCRDLLLSISNASNDNQPLHSSSPSSFNSLVELRAVNVEKAAYYLDYALTERSKSEDNGLSHMFLTLHLYQYHLQNESGISGGRSRLHIIDLGCGRLSEDVESSALSIQGISKVIFALWSHQRYIPNLDSILAQSLKRIVVNSYGMMQTTMLVKVSGKETQYNEALQIVQLASKLYRQKIHSSKLSSSNCSDANSSSSDSFSIRRMTKLRPHVGFNARRLDRSSNSLSLSSDFDATSSSEVSCDTVIYRGQPPNSPPSHLRGSADGSSTGQLGNSPSEMEEKKLEPKLTLFQLKRRTSNKTNSNAWPKVAVKKAKEVMKSGQELWVDGPEAFVSNKENKSGVNNTQTSAQKLKETNDPPDHVPQLDVINEKNEVKEDSPLNSGNANVKTTNKNPHISEVTLNRNKHSVEKFSNETAIKSKMVTDWLRNQPQLHEATQANNTGSLHIGIKGTKLERENWNPVGSTAQRTKLLKTSAEPVSLEHKITTTNFSRIEDWIRTVSIESSDSSSNPLDCGVVMTQSMYSPNCSPYHSAEPRFGSFSTVPLSPPSAPIDYSSNVFDQNPNVLRGTSVPPGSIGSELENECSRLWFYNPMVNERHLMPFVDIIDDSNNNNILPPYSGAPIVNINQFDSLRNSSFRTSSKLSNCPISMTQYEPNLISGSNNIIGYNIPKYSTLPLDTHSPKNTNSKHHSKSKASEQADVSKPVETVSNSQTPEIPPKSTNDGKRSQKDSKKKETKKGFGFLNHLIRNKKLKKEIPINRPIKDESTTTITEASPQTAAKSHDCHIADSIDYVKKAGPPLLLSSPYHMVTQPKTNAKRADSSGHGSDCSSFKEVKSTQVSVNFHQETAGYRFLAYRRAGSSGYESVVRDSELSSHNDSASECSAPTNVVLQSKITNQQTPATNSVTSTPVPIHSTKFSSPDDHEAKIDCENFVKETQKVSELIHSEKLNMLELEQDDLKNELINVLKFFNDDIDGSRKYLESRLSDLEPGEDMKSPEIIKATNQTLRSVLNRYQSNLTLVTSFVGKSYHSDALYD